MYARRLSLLLSPVLIILLARTADAQSPAACGDAGPPKVQLVYAVPSETDSNGHDTNGNIRRSMRAAQHWLETRTQNRLRVIEAGGDYDIKFVQLRNNDAYFLQYPEETLDRLDAELVAAGLVDARTIYFVFYEGDHLNECAQGPHPPRSPGNVAALYLQAHTCREEKFTSSELSAGKREISIVHEVLHAAGFVAAGAANGSGTHVADSQLDLMYDGTYHWEPREIDEFRDDYYLCSPLCPLDLARSALLANVDPNAGECPPGWPIHPAKRVDQVGKAPDFGTTGTASVRVYNLTEEPRQIWLAYSDTDRHHMKSLAPLQLTQNPVRAGDHLVVTDNLGTELQIYEIPEGLSRILIR